MSDCQQELVYHIAKALGYEWMILFNLRTIQSESNDFIHLPLFFKTYQEADLFLDNICASTYLRKSMGFGIGSYYGERMYSFYFTANKIKALTLHISEALADRKRVQHRLRMIDPNSLR